MNKSVIILLLFLGVLEQTVAHFRFRCPTPRSSSTGIKTDPCGTNAFGTGAITTLTPGWNTLIWEESINHPGSPFRVALSVGNDNGYNTHIVLDHIPHNDGSSPVASDTDDKVYGLDVYLPDINCTACGLQMLCFMTDKIAEGDTCTYPGNCTTSTNLYASCADIVITGSTSTSEWFYAYDPQNWPYTQTSGIYTQESGNWDQNTGWLNGQNASLVGYCGNSYPFDLITTSDATSTGGMGTTGDISGIASSLPLRALAIFLRGLLGVASCSMLALLV